MIVFLVAWWCVAAGILTQSFGIGYLSLNIFYAIYASLFITLAMMSMWLEDSTSPALSDFWNRSPTMEPWCFLTLASVFVVGSSADILAKNSTEIDESGDTGSYVLAIVSGSVTIVGSVVLLLSHASFPPILVRIFKPGSYVELLVGVLLLALNTTTVAICTRADGIASTVSTGATPISSIGLLYYSLWFSFSANVWLCGSWRFNASVSESEMRNRNAADATHGIDDSHSDADMNDMNDL